MQKVSRFPKAPVAWSAAWYVGLTFVPLFCLLVFVRSYYVDLPHWDQWLDEAPLIAELYAGTLAWQDLWAQHNEHRPFFARLVWISLARLTGWNIGYELAVSILFAVGTLGVLLYRFSSTMATLGYPRINWVWPLVSLIGFSLTQRGNWLWGFQIPLFMNIFAVVTGLFLLGQPHLRPWSFALALFLGVVATYTITNGILYWGLGLGILLMKYRKAPSLYWKSWVCLSVLAIGFYFYDYQRPPHLPSLQVALEHPFRYAVYVVMFLGAPLQQERYALIPGLLGLILFVWLVWQLHRQETLLLFLPYVGVALYAISSAAVIGLGRVGFGWQQALISRYITISSPLWMVVVILLYGVRQQAKSKVWSSRQTMLQQLGLVLGLVGVAAMVGWGSISSIRPSEERYYFMNETRQALVASSYDDKLLKRLWRDPDHVRAQIKVLKQYRLSIYRDVLP
jgi:hypothetical protein